MHPPIPVTSPRGTNTGQQSWAHYVTRSVQQPLEPESSSYSFFFRVLQFLKFIREFRRDETRLFSNEPLLPRLPIADSKIDPPLPGEIRIRAKRRARWKWERLQFVLSGIKFDLINRKELELIFIFFFFFILIRLINRESFSLDSFWIHFDRILEIGG